MDNQVLMLFDRCKMEAKHCLDPSAGWFGASNVWLLLLVHVVVRLRYSIVLFYSLTTSNASGISAIWNME